jgi:hypothetical protein
MRGHSHTHPSLNRSVKYDAVMCNRIRVLRHIPQQGQQEDTRTAANRIQLTQGVKNRVPDRGSPSRICRGEMALGHVFLQIIHFPLSVPILPMLRRALGPLNFAVPRDILSLHPKSKKQYRKEGQRQER